MQICWQFLHRKCLLIHEKTVGHCPFWKFNLVFSILAFSTIASLYSHFPYLHFQSPPTMYCTFLVISHRKTNHGIIIFSAEVKTSILTIFWWLFARHVISWSLRNLLVLFFISVLQEKLLPNISRLWEGYPHASIPYVSFELCIDCILCFIQVAAKKVAL